MFKSNIAARAAVVTVAALALASCSSDPSPSTEGEGDGGGGTLTVASNSSTKPALDAAIAEFEKANEDITVDVTYANTDAYQTAMRTQLSAGTAPDVMNIPPGSGGPLSVQTIAQNGYLAELSDASWSGDVPAGLDAVTMVDGERYNLPLIISGIGALYNEQAVEAANAEIPTTWSEVLDFCAAAKDAGTVAFALGAQTQWVTQLIPYALVATLVNSENPDFVEQMKAGEASFADSDWTEALSKVTEMQSSGCFQDQPLGTTVEAANAMAAAGDSLAIVTITTQLSTIKDAAPEDATFGMFALPATDNADDTWMPGAAGDSYGINAEAENPAAAEKFLEFLAENDGDYATTGGSLPALPAPDYEVNPTLQVFSDMTAEGRTYPFQNQLWPNAKVQAVFFDGVQQLLGGQGNVEDVLTAMDAAFAE